MTAAAQDGQLVTLHYTMTFEDGTTGDDTRERGTPATVTLGRGELFPALEIGIKAMDIGRGVIESKHSTDVAPASSSSSSSASASCSFFSSSSSSSSPRMYEHSHAR